MKKVIVFGVLVIMLFGLCSCKGQIQGDWEVETEVTGVVVGANPRTENVCVHETGVFSISQGLLCYYDYDSDSSYVLCSAPNCSHTDCVAMAGGGATGFAMYGEYAYYFRRMSNSFMWEFVEVNIMEQSEQVLQILGNDLNDNNVWVITDISEVYYAGGKVWAKLGLLYTAEDSPNGQQLIAIDLKTAKLTEITPQMTMGIDLLDVAFEYFGATSMSYSVRTMLKPCLSMTEYAKSIGQEVVTDDEYYAYFTTCYEKDNLYMTTYLMDMDTMTSTIFSEGGGWPTPYSLSWIHDAEYYGRDTSDGYSSEDGSEQYLTFDSATMEPRGTSLRITNGGVLGWFNGSATFELYNGDCVLYLEYKDEDMCDIYKYDLETGESTYLFEDERYVSFRLVGQTSDKLVGKINESTQFVWIYKEDYEDGNFDEIHKFSPF